MQLRSGRMAAGAAVVGTAALAAAVGVSVGAGASPAPSGTGHGPAHVFVIMLENHSKQSVIGDKNMPYLTSLAHRYSMASRYYGVTHPSEPNYVAAVSGSNWDVNNDSPTNVYRHTNLVDLLTAKHISWAAYMQAMPASGYLGAQWPASQPLYVSKHNPFVLFGDIRANKSRLAQIKPYPSLRTDLNGPNPPAFVWITPDTCSDMHGGVYAKVKGFPDTPCPYGSTNDDRYDSALKRKADAFIHSTVDTIMSSRAWTPSSVIYIVSDEGDYTGNPVTGGWASPAGCCDSPVLPAGDPDISAKWPGGVYGGGLVPAVIVGQQVRRGYVSAVPYNHYSLLRTIEDDWGLPELGYSSDHVQVANMNEFFKG